MKRATSQVCREIADCLALAPEDVKWAEHAKSWLLRLAPPKKKRPRDVPRGAKKGVSVRELDALAREVIFLRDGRKCRKCGKESGLLDWAHVYSRRFRVTRWASEGAMVLCRGCHLWWHQSPTEAVEWWKKEIGPHHARLLEIRKRAAKCGPLENVKIHLEAEKKNLTGRLA